MKRILTAIPLLAVGVVMIFARGFFFYLVLSVFALVAQVEIYKALRHASFRPAVWPGVVFCSLFCLIFTYKGINGLVVVFAVLCATMIACSIMLPQRHFMDTVVSVYALIYPCWFFIFVLLLADMSVPGSIPLQHDAQMLSRIGMAAAILGPVLSDTGAYVVGSTIGRHKLSVNISPKKTVEGAVGGLVVSTAFMAIIGFFVSKYYYGALALWHYPVLGLVCGALGQMGDMAASALKRFTGIKDYGRIFPGHGGVMDRMDSILFGTLGAYCYITLFII